MLEPRFDFRGGLNTSHSPDRLEPTELVLATNTRLTNAYGAVSKRTGSRRMHQTAFGASIKGVYQWDGPGGKQIVAVANGDLFYRNASAGEYAAFSSVSPTPALSTAGPCSFVPFRSTSASAALVLFIADAGGQLWSWDGAGTLTLLTGTDDAPAASLIESYHTRLFCNSVTYKKHIFWSKVGDGTFWTAGGLTDGGSAITDIGSGEAIAALMRLGSSLAIATEDSIVRFTGYSTEDVKLDQDTEGISTAIGVVGPQAFRPFEQFGAALTDKGPYAISEGGVEPIGVKVEDSFDELDRSAIANAVIGYHRGRRELWFAVEGASDTGNQTVYVSATRLGAWMGPWTYPFAITDIARYEDSVGDEWLIAGCSDGFIRHLDIGALDDVLWDNSGGSAITMTVEFAPIFFDNGPMWRKSLQRFAIEADFPTSSAPYLKYAFDNASLTSTAITPLAHNIVENYRVDAYAQGYRLRVQFVDASATIPVINGFMVTAWDMQRV
jgi:hypothetical protein